MRMGINRIRLEFKVNDNLQGAITLCVLIESDWNLKIKYFVILNSS